MHTIYAYVPPLHLYLRALIFQGRFWYLPALVKVLGYFAMIA